MSIYINKMEIINEGQFLISSMNKNKNDDNELNILKEENIILKKLIEDYKKEIIDLKSNLFILEAKNQSLNQNNEILKNELNIKDTLSSSLNLQINKIK